MAGLAQRAGFAQPDDSGNVQRARAHPALVPAAVHLRRDLNARALAANIQRAHALGPIHFVPTERQQVDVVLDHIHRHFAYGLRGVGVQQDALGLGDLADLGNRLDDADFVVGVHDADQNRLVGDGRLQLLQIHQTVGLHREIGDAHAVLFKPLAGVEDGLVLGGRGNDVVALFGIHFGHALQRQIVRFGGAAGEHDLFASGADQTRDLLARLLDRFLGFPTKAVIAAGGIAERLKEIRLHGVEYARIHRGGRVIIHVDWQFHFLVLHCIGVCVGGIDTSYKRCADFANSSGVSALGDSADISEMLMLAKSRRIPS